MHPNYKGPYSIGMIPSREGRERPFRHSDGALTIMGHDADGFAAPALSVPMRAPAKRGEAWKTHDPEQEAFAQWVVDSLNAAAILETSQ